MPKRRVKNAAIPNNSSMMIMECDLADRALSCSFSNSPSVRPDNSFGFMDVQVKDFKMSRCFTCASGYISGQKY